MSGEIIAAILLSLGVGGILVEVVRSALNRKSTATNTTVTISNNALEWSKHALERAKTAEERADKANERSHDAERASDRCRSRTRILEQHIDRLEDIMRANRMDPPPIPAMEEGDEG